MNIIEDFMHDIDMIRKGFELYFLWLPTAINQERPGRERKYAKGFRYIKKIGLLRVPTDLVTLVL